MNAQRIGFRASKNAHVDSRRDRQERAGECAFGQQQLFVGAASFANCPVASSIATT